MKKMLVFFVGVFSFFALNLFAADRDVAEQKPLMMAPVMVHRGPINIKVLYLGKPETGKIDVVFITRVKPGSLAEQAGLKEDMVLISIEGTKLKGLTKSEFEILITRVPVIGAHRYIVCEKGKKETVKSVLIPITPDGGLTDRNIQVALR